MKKAKKKNMILGMIFRIANAWQQKSNSLLGELTLRQFMLLAAMKDMPQTSANLSQLAHAFGGTRQNVRQLVGSLSDKGFVQTGPSDKDKRELLVSLTDKAHAFFAENEDAGDELFSPAFKGVGEKSMDGAIACLSKMIPNLDGDDDTDGR